MKELSIEEKAKRYDEAIEKGNQILNTPYTAHWDIMKEVTEHLFPELKKSEDERIRKGLIEACKQSLIVGGFHKDKVISWLERQGEQKNFFDKIQVRDQVTRNEDGVLVNLSNLPTEGEFPYINPAETLDGEIENIWDRLSCDNKFTATKSGFQEIIHHFANYLKKQKPVEPQQDMLSQEQYAKAVDECVYGEQKPADKVEPKFKVGDWVKAISSGNIFKILSVNDGLYRVLCYDGVEANYPIEVEKDLAYWTIQDAKDGDVLEFGDHGRLVTGILSFVNKTTGKVDVSCLLEGDKFKIGVFYNLDTVKPHPATKEQRDTLMKAMTDAGWQFDFEKKELKKIEQKPVEVSNDDLSPVLQGYIPTIMNKHGMPEIEADAITETAYYFYSLGAKKRAEDKKPKELEWSEEDEKIRSSIINFIRYELNHNAYIGTAGVDSARQIEWLKSLSPQKQCGYNPYKEVVESIAEMCEKYKLPTSDVSDFLDNVRVKCKEAKEYDAMFPQKQWKPSDEQMQVLSNAGNSYRPFEEGHKILWSLYNDLKKLREE